MAAVGPAGRLGRASAARPPGQQVQLVRSSELANSHGQVTAAAANRTLTDRDADTHLALTMADCGVLSLAKSCNGASAKRLSAFKSLSDPALSEAIDCERNADDEDRTANLKMECDDCEKHDDSDSDRCGAHPFVSASSEGDVSKAHRLAPASTNGTNTFTKDAIVRYSMRSSPRAQLQAIGQKLKKTHSLKHSMRNPFTAASAVPLGGNGSTSSGSSQNSDCDSAEGKSKSKKAKGSEAPAAAAAASGAAAGQQDVAAAPGRSLPGRRYSSVRSFLNRVMLQMHLPTIRSRNGAASGRKLDLCEERIAEWKRRFEDAGSVPGVVGIRNHGNTCFINAILQCLSYTDILAEYLVLDQYKSDLKRKRRITSLSTLNKRTGNKGEVTEQLAMLLKSLWSLQYDPEISIRFKSLVDKHASQYKGSSQHDAQEFLLWLLDQVHQDLNTATKNRYKAFKNSGSSNGYGANGCVSDEQLAAEALANYMRCNNSFVTDVFQAQFRSSLTCPTCQRQSNTFDPFLCVSLPIPQKELMPVFVTVLYIDQSPRQVRLGLSIGVHETVGELRRMLSRDTGIDEAQILLAEIDHLGFQKTRLDSQTVAAAVKESEAPMYCIEMPKHTETSEDDGAFIVLTWLNVLKEGPIEKRFGSPYTLQVSRETLYTDLQKLLMKEMSSILHDDILIASQKVPLFKIRVIDGFDNGPPTYLDSSVDLPLYTEAVEQAVNLCSVVSDSGPTHVKLILEWDAPAKSQIINDDSDVVEEHASVKEVSKCPDEAASVTLQECFSLYTSAERLGQGDAWLCPACNRKQEVVKHMALWSVPDVLVIHLKRFRQSATSGTAVATKLSTMVTFPLEGFDMSPYVSKGQPAPAQPQPQPQSQSPASQPEQQGSVSVSADSGANSGGALKMFNVLSPWKHPKRFQNPRSDDYSYDLYAVCNHHGSDLQGGHYTAYCRNPTDGLWYSFDDVHTKGLSEPEVTSEDAYILFYHRHSASSMSSTSSSSSGSSSNQEHWVFRMPDFSYKKPNGSPASAPAPKTAAPASAAATATTNADANSEKPKSEESSSAEKGSSFKRNSGRYATLPAKRVSGVVDCEQDRHSDVEQGCDSDDEEEEEETVVAPEKDINEEDDGICRPIDKNDVD